MDIVKEHATGSRDQRVRIGKAISDPLQLRSGQGPRKEASAPAIIFTTYYAGLEDWEKHFKLLNYADDTSTSHSSQELNTVPNNLDEDTTGIFQFMASNRLVANPSKTKFILQNNKDIETPKHIRVGPSEI